MKEKLGPCIDKKCSKCCDPVKVHRFFPDEKIPRDSDGKPLWAKRRELLVPDSNPDGQKIETYDCKHFDPMTGKCQDYEHRPDICKNSGCVNPDSSEPEEEQFKKLADQKFIKVK